MGWVSYNSDCRGTTSFLMAKHDWTYSSFHDRYVCKNNGCHDKLRKEDHPTSKSKNGPAETKNPTRRDLARGKVPGTVKGGKWGNKADREQAAKMHRQNPPKTEGEKAGEKKGCLEDLFKTTAILLVVGSALIKDIYETVSSIVM